LRRSSLPPASGTTPFFPSANGRTLFSSPFKGEAGRGMVFCADYTAQQHHPHPTLPLKGRASKQFFLKETPHERR